MRPGEQIDLSIENVAFGGDGVGRFCGQVVFVPFTVDGDEVRVRITDVRKKFARGRLEKILKSSDNRTEPRCRHYSLCGGCRYQHIRYEHQLRLKERQVADAWGRIAKAAMPALSSTEPSARIYHYRGKAEYHLRLVPNASPLIGFKDVSNTRIVDVDRCHIVDETINTALHGFRKDLEAGRVKAPPERVFVWSADAAADVVTDFRTPRFVTRTVKGMPMAAPYRGFFQANTSLLPVLVDEVLRLCALTGHETVVDAYCGSGLFSLFLSPQARRVYGIEQDGEAIHCARLNHRRAGFENAVFLRGDSGTVLSDTFAAAKERVDVLVIDPPRTGCEPALLSAVSAIRPSRLVYISCNPATQARDIGRLLEQGFHIIGMRSFDMFPQTAHIETVALLAS